MTQSDASTLLDALRQRHGTPHVLAPDTHTDNELAPYLNDWRGRYSGRAFAIIRPADTAAVADAVRFCRRHGLSIVPQGGHTGLVGGGTPDASGQQVVIQTSRLNQVTEVDAANQSLVAQAGCTLAQVQQAADHAGLLFPLSLASEGSCTIGGNLATNAGGTQVLRYGTARALCLGLEAVLPNGEIWHGLKSLRKDNTGYALRDLLIGSEGTLGLITAASLRLHAKPASTQAALLVCPDIQQAVELLQLARSQLDAQLCGFEVMHRYPLQLLAQHLPQQAHCLSPLQAALQTAPWLVLLDVSSTQAAASLNAQLESLMARALEADLIVDGTLAQNDSQHRAMWALRESIPFAEKAEALMVKHDIAVPTSKVPAFLYACEAALQQAFPGCRVVCFGHLGDGNLHYNVQAPTNTSARAFIDQRERAVNQVVYDIALSLGGTISAEHGIGKLKRQELRQRQGPAEASAMRAIKHALDPAGTFNPGSTLT